jgi:hypothetical protein
MAQSKRIAVGQRVGKRSKKVTPGKVRYRKRVRCPVTGRKLSVVTKKG